MLNKKIATLIEEDFVLARALHYLGVDFMQHGDKTIIEVCKERKLALKNVLKTFDNFHNSSIIYRENLHRYPLDLVIAYLKHAHHIFIKERLPYVHSLINRVNLEVKTGSSIIDDLRLIFPVFLEDFIKHIYEEEDTVFDYALRLHELINSNYTGLAKFVYLHQEISLAEIAKDHHEEDELAGLKELVNALKQIPEVNIHINLIVKELENFELEMVNHAMIEDEILFPRAVEMEKRLSNITKIISQQN